jgi:hypothetical protein
MASSCPFRRTLHEDLFLNLTFLNRALLYTYVIGRNKMLTFYINDLINYVFDIFRTSKCSSSGKLIALYPWLKWPVCESDKVSPSSANVKNGRTYNSTPLYALMPCTETIFTFTLLTYAYLCYFCHAEIIIKLLYFILRQFIQPLL